MENLVEVCGIEGQVHGPAFATPNGKVAMSVDYNSVFQQYLRLAQENTNLIPEDQEVDTCFSTNRTPRKMVVTRLK
jgi:hypothetical protein